jgi:CubicO group peptidase (beta-lactamase class C family)/predicted alpha/beta superfamily hydrolase
MRFCLLSVLTVGLLAVAAAQSPETPAGRQLTAWLDAYNTGNIDIMRRFVAESYDKEKLKSGAKPVDFLFLPVYPETRVLRFDRMLYENERKAIGLTQSTLTGEWYRVTVRSGADPRELYMQGIFRDVEPEEAHRYGKLSEAEIVHEMADYLQRLHIADAFSGTVLIANGGKPIFSRAYGWANRERNERNRVETKFQLASLSKIFAGVSICQLLQAGKLSFSDPIGKILPDYPNATVAGKVTVQQLLAHTSGMGDFLDKKDYQAAESRLTKPADFFPFFAADPLAFEPGEDEQYSNAGYIVLGAIIEKVSGQRYSDYVREHIFKPVRMVNSGFNDTAADIAGLATGYRNDGWNPEFKGGLQGSPLLRKGDAPSGSGSAAGGGYATAEDLLRFGEALVHNKLLNQANTARVLSGRGQLGDPGFVPSHEAYGFHYDVANGKHIIGHNGGSPGVSTRLDLYVDQGYQVVVLSNYDGPMGSIVANRARALLTQDLRPSTPLPGPEFRIHAGFHSKFLPVDRDVVVWLPPSYESEPARRYPVLYMNDGEQVFGAGWHMDETAQALARSGEIQPLIIVGIHSTGEYRTDEYTPTFGPVIGAGGKADLYGRMIVEELKPMIDSRYRTLTDAGNTGIGGSSYGGLVALYLGLKYPLVIGKLALVSPSVWWNNRVILRDVEALKNKPEMRIWLDCGTAEGPQARGDVRLLRDALLAKGWSSGSDLKYVEAVGALHMQQAWARRVDPMLRFLFPK